MVSEPVSVLKRCSRLLPVDIELTGQSQAWLVGGVLLGTLLCAGFQAQGQTRPVVAPSVALNVGSEHRVV